MVATRETRPRVTCDPARTRSTWLLPEKSSSSDVSTSSEFCVVNAGELRIAGICRLSHASPVAIEQSCMSLHMFGVIHE